MILRILLVAAVLVAAILVFAFTKPDSFRVQRSLSINAPPEKIFALINDFHSWSLWAPQDREDPSMQRTYSGSERGTAAVSDWTSTGSAGQGRMSIVESVPPTKVLVKVDFTKPFSAHNTNEFTLEQDGALTKVTWTSQGTNLYIMKLVSIFVSMDKLMGKHFATGLHNVKTLAEK
jgi:hypothetical protein